MNEQIQNRWYNSKNGCSFSKLFGDLLFVSVCFAASNLSAGKHQHGWAAAFTEPANQPHRYAALYDSILRFSGSFREGGGWEVGLVGIASNDSEHTPPMPDVYVRSSRGLG